MRRPRTAAIAVVGLLALWAAASATAQTPAATTARPIVVGSKPFGESYLLAEIFAQLLEARGLAVSRRFGLGGTEIVFPALQQGAIDVFPEYTGSGLLVILKAPMDDRRYERHRQCRDRQVAAGVDGSARVRRRAREHRRRRHEGARRLMHLP